MIAIKEKLKENVSVPIALFSLIFFMFFEKTFAHSEVLSLVGFISIFAVIIYSAITVAHHAEALAEKFGEPYGTLILTISAVLVEVIIIAIIMVDSKNITLAKDTIYSALMLDINGILGLAAIIGGLKHGEQKYNMDSSNSYMAMIIVAVGVGMIMPYFVPVKNLHMYYIFITIMFMAMYIVFTKIQTKKHKYFFEYEPEKGETSHKKINAIYHASILIGSIILIGLLSEVMSEFMNETLKASALPIGLGAIIVAIISASPELLTAIKSASKDNMQTVVNIALGASLATILLTIPAVLIVSMIVGMPIDLKLSMYQIVLLSLTFLSAMIIFNDGETNVLEGFSHIVIFSAFIFFAFIQ
jgi:Ca2+:H+ antiporter